MNPQKLLIASPVVRTITPQARVGLLRCGRDLWEYRELFWSLTLRDLKVRYKQSVLGFGWTVLQPLAFTVLFSIVFTRFIRVPTADIPYPLFALCGLLPWTFFSAFLSAAGTSVVGNGNLVTKVYFPREIFPLAVLTAACINFLVACSTLVGLMALYRIMPSVHILWLPLILLVQLAFSIGIGLFLAGANVFYRHIQALVPILAQLWMYASPIIYPTSVVPERWQLWYSLNPMVGILDGYRQALLLHRSPDLQTFLCAAVIAVTTFFAGYRVFKSLEDRFADVI